jgi:predicted SnoaL-like aldol condensation-catalyzing enzyme
MSPTQIVLAAVSAIFTESDPVAAAALLHGDYIQHNPAVPTGAAPIIGFIPALKASGIRVTNHRMISDGDFVVLHSTYENAAAFGADKLVAFDVFRVSDGKVAEHWDNLQPPCAPNPSGRTMIDGETIVSDHTSTEANKKLVAEFARNVLIEGRVETVADYISGSSYLQHNPMVADGLDGLATAFAALAKAGRAIRYTKIHRLLGEGNFVFLMSEGLFGDTPTAYFDLFRVDLGKIVEHWDVISDIPDLMAHSNGKF